MEGEGTSWLDSIYSDDATRDWRTEGRERGCNEGRDLKVVNHHVLIQQSLQGNGRFCTQSIVIDSR